MTERLTETLGEEDAGEKQEPEQEAAPVEMDEDLLIQDYYRVQSREIVDAATIRRLAGKFAAIANDAVAVKQVCFDAAHAALQLYTYADSL